MCKHWCGCDCRALNVHTKQMKVQYIYPSPSTVHVHVYTCTCTLYMYMYILVLYTCTCIISQCSFISCSSISFHYPSCPSLSSSSRKLFLYLNSYSIIQCIHWLFLQCLVRHSYVEIWRKLLSLQGVLIWTVSH